MGVIESLERLKTVEVEKGAILQHQGELNGKVYVVHKGILRSYIIDEKCKEHTYLFAPEGWIMGDLTPPDLPCQLYIDCIEKALVSIHHKDDFLEDHPQEVLLRRMLAMQRRILMLMSFSAMDRYKTFCDTYPEMSKRLPQKLIASYLGITPEALSKLKHSM